MSPLGKEGDSKVSQLLLLLLLVLFVDEGNERCACVCSVSFCY